MSLELRSGQVDSFLKFIDRHDQDAFPGRIGDDNRREEGLGGKVVEVIVCILFFVMN